MQKGKPQKEALDREFPHGQTAKTISFQTTRRQ
jgi:hypothetical protein